MRPCRTQLAIVCSSYLDLHQVRELVWRMIPSRQELELRICLQTKKMVQILLFNVRSMLVRRERFAEENRTSNWTATGRRTPYRSDRVVRAVCFVLLHSVPRCSTSIRMDRSAYQINQFSDIVAGRPIVTLFRMILYRMPSSNCKDSKELDHETLNISYIDFDLL